MAEDERGAGAAGTRNSTGRKKSSVLRPPGFIVFGVFLLAVGLVWYLVADRVVEQSVEAAGASLTGARVDLESADIRPRDGSIRLIGLAAANPDRPMRNLFEADEIVGDLMLAPLLEKKIVVERLSIRGVRFDTERTESGALENPDPEAGALWREVNRWAEAVTVPSLSLDGLAGVVRVEAISEDSLATVRYARALASRADSLRTDWGARLEGLDPRPRIDSVGRVIGRLEDFRLTPLNAVQLPGLIRDGRESLELLASLQAEIAVLDDSVRSQISSFDLSAERFQALRTEDLAYARGLLNIPSLEGPSISRALFGGSATAWLKPVLYWAQTAERFLPPGLDPRNRPGPDRVRASGTTYDFRRGATWPDFLIQEGDVDVEVGSSGPFAGSYSAAVRAFSSAPSLVSRPAVIEMSRTGGTEGPEALSLSVVIDHTSEVLRDSLFFDVSSVELPSLGLDAFGGQIVLGRGDASLAVRRIGEEIDVVLRWTSDNLVWDSEDEEAPGAAAPPIGSAEWGRRLVERSIADLGSIQLEMGLSGAITSPSLSVSSNIGQAIAASLRREVGAEVAAAEARLRGEVDERIQPVVSRAISAVDSLTTGVGAQLGANREEVAALRARLESRIEELRGGRELP
jgi:uncharacterized protein (TIGR03545 family)